MKGRPWFGWSDAELAVIDLWIGRIGVRGRAAAAHRLHTTVMAHRTVGAIEKQIARRSG